MKLIITILLLVMFNLTHALEYKLSADQLTLSGSIDERDVELMPQYLTPDINVVVFHNIAGGDATTTLRLLTSFEEQPRIHVIKGYCASACTLFFLAGSHRVLATSDSYIGFHSVYSYDTHKINPHLSGAFQRYIATRLGPRYDHTLFTFVFERIKDSDQFLIFNSGHSGKLCTKSRCIDKTAKTAFDLGIVTARVM